MRADAFVTLKLVHPLRKLFPPKGRRVPILMYHSVSNTPESVHPYYRTVTSPQMFARQMRHLHDNRYSVVSISDALQYLDGSKVLRSQPIVLTFDDGYGDFYTEAFPVLDRYGFTAIVYLPTAFIGQSSKPFKGIGCLTWNQVRELEAAGIEFGSHTVNHPQLRSLAVEDVRRELNESKRTIEYQLGKGVSSFSYPYAFPETDRKFKQTLRSLLKEAGFQNGVSTVLRTAEAHSDPLCLGRLPLNDCDDNQLFDAKLLGAYDWLHTAQYASKRWKSGTTHS